MKPEIATIHERMAQGGDWRDFQREIAALHNEATTEAEYVVLLEAHRRLVAVGEQAYDAETYAKLLPVARSEYLMFLIKESLEGGVTNPIILDRVTHREVEAGRMEADDEFRSMASAGAATIGDSSELHAHKCRHGDYFFFGMTVASIAALLLSFMRISPLWLIAIGLVIGWFLNKRERKRIKAEITTRRA